MISGVVSRTIRLLGLKLVGVAVVLTVVATACSASTGEIAVRPTAEPAPSVTAVETPTEPADPTVPPVPTELPDPTVLPVPTESPLSNEIVAEPVTSLGEDPFSPPVVPGSPGGPEPVVNTDDPKVDEDAVEAVVTTLNPPVGKSSDVDRTGIELPPPAPGQVTNIGGNAPGLYGGTNVLNVCDKDLLVGFLTGPGNEAKVRAWAGVLGTPADSIPSYIDGLTAVVLRLDTRVTNHGFSNGVAYPVDAVLQAGTAVLIDDYGVPRVRCYCGNPLLPARPLATTTPTVTGTQWPGLVIEQTIVITQVTQITVIEINNIYGGGVIYVNPGEPIGAYTFPTPVAAPTPEPEPTPEPDVYSEIWDGEVSDEGFVLPFVIEMFDRVGDDFATITIDAGIDFEGVAIFYKGSAPLAVDFNGDFSADLPLSISSSDIFADALVTVTGSFATREVTMCEVAEGECITGSIRPG